MIYDRVKSINEIAKKAQENMAYMRIPLMGFLQSIEGDVQGCST